MVPHYLRKTVSVVKKGQLLKSSEYARIHRMTLREQVSKMCTQAAGRLEKLNILGETVDQMHKINKSVSNSNLKLRPKSASLEPNKMLDNNDGKDSAIRPTDCSSINSGVMTPLHAHSYSQPNFRTTMNGTFSEKCS